MLFPLFIIVLLATAFSHIDAATLKGVIHENVQSGEPIPNANITALGANLTTSDSFGNFTLDFKSKDPGYTVTITVIKSGYTVVNRESLVLNLPASSRIDEAVVAIVLCRAGDYEQKRHQYDVFIAGGIEYVASKSKEQVSPNGDPSKTNFEPYIKEWASQYGLSVEQAQAEVEKWAADVKQKRDSVSDLALAEFINKHFDKAKDLFKQSAQQTEQELENSERKEEEQREQSKKLRAKLVNELRRAGDSSYNDYQATPRTSTFGVAYPL
jgi:hypothetical protein